jgi:hypothetical protein
MTQDNDLATIAELARAARQLADRLHGDLELAATRLEHQRLTQRAAEAARLAAGLEAVAE